MPKTQVEKVIMEKLITTHLLAVDQAFVYRWLSGFFVRELEGQVLNAYNTPEGKVLLDQLASRNISFITKAAVPLLVTPHCIQGDGRVFIFWNIHSLTHIYFRYIFV